MWTQPTLTATLIALFAALVTLAALPADRAASVEGALLAALELVSYCMGIIGCARWVVLEREMLAGFGWPSD